MSTFRLISDDDGRALVDTQSRQRPLRIDFGSRAMTHRRKTSFRSRERLSRALGAGPGVKVVDCTAGLGRDSFMLASFGCQVTMLERSPAIAALLRDALERARTGNVHDIVSRMQLVEQDAIDYLRNMDIEPDAIYLDPMFPARTKRASVKGEMQMLQRFIGFDEDAQVLMQTALATDCPRVVLKRPAHGGAIVDEIAPSYTLKGRTSRFEVFLKGNFDE